MMEEHSRQQNLYLEKARLSMQFLRKCCRGAQTDIALERRSPTRQGLSIHRKRAGLEIGAPLCRQVGGSVMRFCPVNIALAPGRYLQHR